jgi:SAM-dependent methyltransferase
MSDAAVAFARELSATSGLDATFHESEMFAFLDGPLEQAPFDLVYGSYGCIYWLDDLPRWFAGIARRLAPSGRVVILEFHPMAWSFDERFALSDPYFAPGRIFSQAVDDYVRSAGGALSPSGHVPASAPYHNPHEAHGFQHTVSDIVSAALACGLEVEALREWPYSNGCKVCPGLVACDGDPRRFTTPPGVPNVPLMLGFSATRR